MASRAVDTGVRGAEEGGDCSFQNFLSSLAAKGLLRFIVNIKKQTKNLAETLYAST